MNETLDIILNKVNESIFNVTYLTEDEKLLEDRLEDELPLFVMFILIILGTVGNCLVCLAILFDRKLQNMTNFFLLSLAITDLIISLIILPTRMTIVRYRFQPRMFPLCFFYLVGDDYITAASAIHICFISFERYLAIRNPLNKMNLTKRRVAVKIGLVWFLSFITVIPYMTSAITTKHSKKPHFCPEILAYFNFFDGIVFIEAMIIVTMIVIVITSFVLTNNVLNKIIKAQQENESQGDMGLVRTVGGKQSETASKKRKVIHNLKSEQKALKVIWLVSFAFIISMGPYACITLFYVAFPKIIIPPLLPEIAAYFTYANSVINPIIYTIFNKAFRKNFKNLLLFKHKKNI